MRPLPFFTIPSMRTFKGQLLTDKDIQPTLSISHSPISHLEFVQCTSALGFNDLIRMCDNPTSFKYTQQEDNNLPASPDYKGVYFKTLQAASLAEDLYEKGYTALYHGRYLPPLVQLRRCALG